MVVVRDLAPGSMGREIRLGQWGLLQAKGTQRGQWGPPGGGGSVVVLAMVVNGVNGGHGHGDQ